MQVKPLVRGQTFVRMLGYVHKDRHLSHFKNISKGVTDAEIEEGISEHAALKLSYMDDKIVVNKTNMFQRVLAFDDTNVDCTFLEMMTRMLNTDKYILSATLLMNSAGQMRESAAEAYYASILGKSVDEEDVRAMLFIKEYSPPVRKTDEYGYTGYPARRVTKPGSMRVAPGTAGRQTPSDVDEAPSEGSTLPDFISLDAAKVDVVVDAALNDGDVDRTELDNYIRAAVDKATKANEKYGAEIYDTKNVKESATVTYLSKKKVSVDAEHTYPKATTFRTVMAAHLAAKKEPAAKCVAPSSPKKKEAAVESLAPSSPEQENIMLDAAIAASVFTAQRDKEHKRLEKRSVKAAIAYSIDETMIPAHARKGRNNNEASSSRFFNVEATANDDEDSDDVEDEEGSLADFFDDRDSDDMSTHCMLCSSGPTLILSGSGLHCRHSHVIAIANSSSCSVHLRKRRIALRTCGRTVDWGACSRRGGVGASVAVLVST